MTPPMMLSSLSYSYTFTSLEQVCVCVGRIFACVYISVYESIHTGVEHDNNVDDLLIVHIHRHQLLSKRKRRGEKKTHKRWLLRCVVCLSFFARRFFSPRCSILFLLSSLDARTRQQWRKKEKGKESTYMYVYMHTRI